MHWLGRLQAEFTLKLFEKFEMRAIKNLGQIWENDCEKNFQCPFKLGTCNCKAILFKRDSI